MQGVATQEPRMQKKNDDLEGGPKGSATKTILEAVEQRIARRAEIIRRIDAKLIANRNLKEAQK